MDWCAQNWALDTVRCQHLFLLFFRFSRYTEPCASMLKVLLKYWSLMKKNYTIQELHWNDHPHSWKLIGNMGCGHPIITLLWDHTECRIIGLLSLLWAFDCVYWWITLPRGGTTDAALDHFGWLNLKIVVLARKRGDSEGNEVKYCIVAEWNWTSLELHRHTT